MKARSLLLLIALVLTLPAAADCVQVNINSNASNTDLQITVTLTTAQTQPVVLNQAVYSFPRGLTRSMLICGETNPKSPYIVMLSSSTTDPQAARTQVGWRGPVPNLRACGIGARGGFTCTGNL